MGMIEPLYSRGILFCKLDCFVRTGAQRRAAPAGGGAARARHRDGPAEPARRRGAHAESEWVRVRGPGRDERDAGGPRGCARHALREAQPRARLAACLSPPGRRRLPSRRSFAVGLGIGDLRRERPRARSVILRGARRTRLRKRRHKKVRFSAINLAFCNLRRCRHLHWRKEN